MSLLKYNRNVVKLVFLQVFLIFFWIYLFCAYFYQSPINFQPKLVTNMSNVKDQRPTKISTMGQASTVGQTSTVEQISTMDSTLRLSYDKKSIKCYRYPGETLTDISLMNVRKGKSIFFHETSCNSYINDKIVITSREACAVESAAKLNPDLDVYLTYTSPGKFKFEDSESDRLLDAIMSYDNVRINHLNYEKYTKGTPVEELYSKGAIEASHYAMSHASDVLRYLTLWKYGGIYLDLDIVVIKSLQTLPPNFSGCQSEIEVAAGIMGFQPDGNGNGHLLAEECVMDLKKHFSGVIWGNNGPDVVTRLVRNHCNGTKIQHLYNKVCDNFKIFSPDAFYAIGYPSWRLFFDDKQFEEIKKATTNSYIIHVWNNLSSSTKLLLNSTSPYSQFAKKYCPRVYEQCDEYF